MYSDIQQRIEQALEEVQGNGLEKIDLIKLSQDCLAEDIDHETLYAFLELAHFSSVSKHISEFDQIDKWLNNLIKLIKRSKYHTGHLLKQRANRYNNKTVFNLIREGQLKTISYSSLWSSVIEVGRALSTFEKELNKPVSIGLLTHNQLNGVLVDLACLSFGFRVIPIPLNATPEHISYILEHGEITNIFIGGKAGVRLWNELQDTRSIEVVTLDNNESLKGDITSWDQFLQKGDGVIDFDPDDRLRKVDMEHIQTIMYTSGTTANPKGIVFNQMNIMSKRFARALALPDIGSNDIFLCYLPLFHTFGRYFELIGSIFWGASYSFAESPAFNSLLNDYKIIKPTIFISIPKRWVQLYEMLDSQLELDSEDDSTIDQKLKDITGGSLKWGLSAAGYLDPDIFTFFHKHGIELLSGYGMTQATGGITMTPPRGYVRDSVGEALPGIQLKLEDDGELCIKGPYVSQNYYKENDSDIYKDGWLHTEDIFEQKNGHYFIIDRKKDIYKNSRGQTIAPQKIENLFQDFDSVKSVFLVGDGREFNTVLIYPDHEGSSIDLKTGRESEIRDLFSSMILSVNSFLSPFERIVNYVVINRNFSEEKGELTPKGTFIRKVILENFKDIILPLYEKNYTALHFQSKELRIPNWLVREIGTVKSNLKWDGHMLLITDQPRSLPLTWSGSIISLGDFQYEISADILDFDELIQSPDLWLGNFKFSDFVGTSIFRLKEAKVYDHINIIIPESGTSFDALEFDDNKIETILYSIHRSVREFISDDPAIFNDLRSIVDNDLGNWSTVLINTYMNYQDHSKPLFRIKMIESLAPLLSGELFITMIHDSYIYQRKIDPSKGLSFDIGRTNDDHFHSTLQYLQKIMPDIETASLDEKEFIKTLLFLIADFGILHPTRFVIARSELINWQLSNVPRPLQSTAQKAYYGLVKGFRTWIGQSTNIAVDPETGEEYQWEDVLTFDDNVRHGHKDRILHAIRDTSLIKESLFLFSKNFLIDLNDIPNNGVWISHLGSRNNKSVFRVIVKTRSFGNHNLVMNLNEGWEREFIDDETKWLIKMGPGFKDDALVENFGGYWPEHQLYTEEYIQGETLDNYLNRNKKDINDRSKMDRWQMRWLHFIWSGIEAYQGFWNRTNFKLSIQPPKPENLIIPQHDYKTGTRLISISGRKPIQSISDHFLELYTDYIIQTEQKYPGLSHMSDWEVIFTATIQVLKVKKGYELLNKLRSELSVRTVKNKCEQTGLTIQRIDDFLDDVDKFGVLTKPVVFASLRYERWLDLNQGATLKAKASILKELYKDYKLNDLLDDYPETRVRFFMMTCFKDSDKLLFNEFQAMIQDMRNSNLSPWNLQDRITEIQSRLELNENEEFFLARMLFPHVDSADYVELVTTTHGEEARLNLVYQTECKDGKLYRIRPPFLPKEIAHFHTLLSESALSVTFTSEHEFLLAFNSRNTLVGGLYWKNMGKDRIHLEWVAIKNKYQKIALSKRLMSDFFKRMKHINISHITVGFYAQEFFFNNGFKIEKQYGGMVKEL